ncbi:HAL/PAL/TAL family ammonia-lyase [Kitasatospora aureofaciens]|uniref:HAL/PAL/TAL family ammonia-lyase n=1 Tax=Kitasatospora aureofaciens TaxID=1894 RepID=UPI002108B748|nr:aromatic amino acid ammonia-lyase [Kitasatospora aureofaciens]
MTERAVLDGRSLTIAQVVQISRGEGQVGLSEAAAERLRESRSLKLDLIATQQPIYGVTTGFGDSANNQISPAKAAELQRNMIRYHLNGTGPAATAEVARATLLIRANCLARGNSAVNPAIVDRLLDLLRHDALPVIPERGSVGASGDLVPMCYVAAPLIGEGELLYQGSVRPAADVLAELGLDPIVPEAKDGLALINGTSFSSAYAALAIARAEELAVLAETCTALASEGLNGNRSHFNAFIHEEKPHPGQITSARRVAEILADSGLALEHSQVLGLSDALEDRGYQRLTRTIQDRYSIRCAPHVIGVLRDTIDWARRWIEIEINSSNDNPLFDVAGGTVHSGGNFYGGHVVQAMDALKVAVANVADLLDRQLELLVDEKFNNGLTPNLIAPVQADEWAAGLHHGFKGMQLACSAITAEALKNTNPVSVFSRSTEAHNQDKVSMSPIAARDARTIVDLVQEVVAIHLLAACQAVEIRGAGQLATRSRAVHDLVRTVAPFVDTDRRMDADIQAVLRLIRSGELVDAARSEEERKELADA